MLHRRAQHQVQVKNCFPSVSPPDPANPSPITTRPPLAIAGRRVPVAGLLLGSTAVKLLTCKQARPRPMRRLGRAVAASGRFQLSLSI
jgi:hypothetical protein